LFDNAAAEAHFAIVKDRRLTRRNRRDRLVENDFNTLASSALTVHGMSV
jgi:hypothetical protein